eukprot:7186455-Alexandrium_andersonii.AAC.1
MVIPIWTPYQSIVVDCIAFGSRGVHHELSRGILMRTESSAPLTWHSCGWSFDARVASCSITPCRTVKTKAPRGSSK